MSMASEVYEMNLEEENERLKAEIDVIQNELNCAVETNGQLQDSCNELVEMLEEVRKILGDRPIADKVAALIATYRGKG